MEKRFITERVARRVIICLFTICLVGALVFIVSPQMQGLPFVAHATPANQPIVSEDGERYYKPMPEAVRRQLALMGELEELTGQLNGLQSQLNEAQQQLASAEGETQRMAEAQLEMMDAVQMQYAGEYYATAYCCEEYPHICGGNGVTASGTKPTPGLTCAADWGVFPPGTWLYIEGVGLRRVEDSGSAIKGRRLDIAVDTHQNALSWGGQGRHHVWVMNLS